MPNDADDVHEHCWPIAVAVALKALWFQTSESELSWISLESELLNLLIRDCWGPIRISNSLGFGSLPSVAAGGLRKRTVGK